MLLSVETLTVLILTQIESIFSGEIVTPSDGVHIGEKVTEDLEQIRPSVLWENLRQFAPTMLTILYQIFIAGIIFFVSVRCIRWVIRGLEKVMNGLRIDAGMKSFLLGCTKGLLYTLVIFVVAERLGISSASVVAIIGSAGLAIGLALQGSLSNFAGGILILFMKPFVVGDYIVSNLGEGRVKEIGIVYTTLITADNKKITMPNGILSNGVITNATAETTRRVSISVGVSYRADIKLAKHVLEEVLRREKGILKDREIEAFVEELGTSSVLLGARGWCKSGDYWKTRCRILEEAKYALEKSSIPIAYNQLTVHLGDGEEASKEGKND